MPKPSLHLMKNLLTGECNILAQGNTVRFIFSPHSPTPNAYFTGTLFHTTKKCFVTAIVFNLKSLVRKPVVAKDVFSLLH